jgi:peptidase E
VTDRIVVAMGGGGFSMEPDNPLLDDEILNLARAARGRRRPRICFIATENMMAVWRVHGVDRALRRAWESGVVMAGLSAGSLCWFETGTTDSFGAGLAVLSGGLGFLPGSHAPHYDGEPTRRGHYQRLVADGAVPAGYAADDGAALVFHGTELAEVVTSRREARGYRVERGPAGDAVETVLPVRYLG